MKTEKGATIGLLLVILLPASSAAQGEGTRVYLPAPAGTNVFSATFMDLKGTFNFAQDILVAGASIESRIGVPSYVRFFPIAGRLSELWVSPILGSVQGSASAGAVSVRVPRISGLADPYLGIRVGLTGAPGLVPAQFAKYKQTFQVYGLFGVTPPIGKYSGSSVLNLGTNRWAFRGGVPLVAPFGDAKRPVWLEVVPSVTFFTVNADPFGPGQRRSQAPLVVVENHLSYNLTTPFWAALDLRGQSGAGTTTDGVSDGNTIRQLGGGATVGYQVNKALGLQTTYGRILAKRGSEKGDMWRLRGTYAF